MWGNMDQVVPREIFCGICLDLAMCVMICFHSQILVLLLEVTHTHFAVVCLYIQIFSLSRILVLLLEVC